MSSVDNKVVSLTFDNASFQKRAGDTMSTLDKLKQALNFSGSGKSLGDLQQLAGKFNMDSMATTIEGVSTKFLALSTIAITALSNITTKAMEAGAQFANSFSFEPVMDGFREYETSINAVQVILANTKSKGTTIDQVNVALDQLNDYADKTIYNFGEMTKNIGAFTAAGVDLDTSVKSIKGISNIAAMSGSSAQQASVAMYQLSQAISAGTVRLMDWKSVENANMGGEAFKTALFETGKAMGTLANVPLDQSFTEWEASGNSFRESLSDEWLTADVLTTTLAAISGDLDGAALSAKGFSDAQIVAMQDLAATSLGAATEVKSLTQMFGTIKESVGSGWASSFRLILGNFIEAKELFTGINSYITGFVDRSTNARNELLAGWKAFGGRNELLGALMNSFAALHNVLKPIKDAFREVFPPMTAERLINLTTGLKEFTAKLVMSEATMEKVKSIFEGFFSVLKIGVEIIKGVFSVFSSLAGIIFGFSDGALTGAAGVGNFVSKIREMLVEGGGIKAFFDAINDKIKTFGEWVEKGREKLGSLFGGKGGGDDSGGSSKFSEAISKIVDKLKGLSVVGEKVGEILSKIGDAIGTAFSGIADAVGGVVDAIVSFFSNLGSAVGNAINSDTFDTVLQVFKVGFLGGLTAILGGFLKNGLKLDFGQSKLLESISGAFDQLGGSLKALQLQLKADALLKIAKAVGLLAVSVLVLAFIPADRIAKGLGAMTAGLAGITTSLAILSKVESNPAKLAGLGVALTTIAGAMVAMSVAIWLFSNISYWDIIKGLGAVFASLAILTPVAILLGNVSGSFIRASISLGLLAIALAMLAGVVWIFSRMDLSEIGVGLIGIAGVLAVVSIASVILAKSGIEKVGLGLTLFAFGVKTLHKVIEGFAKMDFWSLAKGIGAFGAMLYLLVWSFNNFPKGKKMQKQAVGLLVMSAAMFVIGKAIETIARLNFLDVIEGVGALAIMLVMLVSATNALNMAQAGVAGMITLSIALLVMAKALEVVGNLSFGQIVMGLIGVAGALLVLTGVAVLLTIFPPVLAALNAMGVALMLIGAGFALMGIGAFLVAKAFEAVSNAGKKGIETLIEVIGVLIKAIPGFMEKLAEGLVSLFMYLVDSAPKMIEGVNKVLTMIIDAMIKFLPKIGQLIGGIIDLMVNLMFTKGEKFVNAALFFLLKFMEGLNNNMPMIVEAGMEMLVKFLEGVADKIDEVILAGADLLLKFIQGLTDKVPEITMAVLVLIATFLQAISDNLHFIVDAGASLFQNLIIGITTIVSTIADTATQAIVFFIYGLTKNALIMIRAGIDMVKTLINGIAMNIEELVTSGKDAVLKFLEGLGKNVTEFADAGMRILTNFLNELAKVIDRRSGELRDAGLRIIGAVVNGMTGGLAEKAKEVANGAIDMAKGMVDGVKGFLGINSPSKVFKAIGGGIGEGFVLGIKDGERPVNKASTSLANTAVRSINSVLSNLSTDLEGMNEFNPTITPVLDLSSVTRDAKAINSLVSATNVSAQVSFQNADLIARTTDLRRDQTPTETQPTGPTEVKFEQNIYSPTPLTANEIYRNTKNQIALAKEELKIR